MGEGGQGPTLAAVHQRRRRMVRIVADIVCNNVACPATSMVAVALAAVVALALVAVAGVGAVAQVAAEVAAPAA